MGRLWASVMTIIFTPLPPFHCGETIADARFCEGSVNAASL